MKGKIRNMERDVGGDGRVSKAIGEVPPRWRARGSCLQPVTRPEDPPDRPEAEQGQASERPEAHGGRAHRREARGDHMLHPALPRGDLVDLPDGLPAEDMSPAHASAEELPQSPC